MSVEAAQPRVASRVDRPAEAWWVFATVPLLASAVAFTWMLHAELQRAYGMTALAWDLAYYQQVVWEITQGHGFYSSFARGNFLGVHLEPILLVMAAVEKVWPSPVVLLIFGPAGLAATGPAAYLFFRAILPDEPDGQPASRWLALALATPIPFWAAIQEAASDFFHPENMALPLALVAAWAGIRGRRVAMWPLCVLTLTCKEDQVYTIGVLALLMRSFGAPSVARHWRFILYLAAGWFLVGAGLVQQYYRDYGYTDIVYYRWLIGLDADVPVTPLAVLEALFRPEALLMVAAIFASLAALPMLAPRWSLLVIPPYLANVLSAHPTQNTLNLHYVLLLLFPMIVAAGVGGRRLLERRTLSPATALAAMLPALAVGYLMGPLPPSLGAYDYLYTRPNAVAQLMQAAAVIPAGAPVNADSGLDVWLANRHQINDFPDKLDPSAYVVIDKKSYLGGPTDFARHREERAALPASGRSLLYDDGRFQVWSPVSD
jgi:uncharacterized membrane protein